MDEELTIADEGHSSGVEDSVERVGQPEAVLEVGPRRGERGGELPSEIFTAGGKIGQPEAKGRCEGRVEEQEADEEGRLLVVVGRRRAIEGVAVERHQRRERGDATGAIAVRQTSAERCHRRLVGEGQKAARRSAFAHRVGEAFVEPGWKLAPEGSATGEMRQLVRERAGDFVLRDVTRWQGHDAGPWHGEAGISCREILFGSDVLAIAVPVAEQQESAACGYRKRQANAFWIDVLEVAGDPVAKDAESLEPHPREVADEAIAFAPAIEAQGTEMSQRRRDS